LRQWTRWCAAAGQTIPADPTGLPEFSFEVSPLFADSPEAFQARGAQAVVHEGVCLEG
jgi:hypothetical protein